MGNFFNGLYKKIETQSEYQIADKIVNDSWEEMGYNKTYEVEGERFLVTNQDGLFVASFEMIPFKKSKITKVFDFNSIDIIREFKNRTVEIERFAILNPYRGSGVLERVIASSLLQCEEEKIKYFIAVINPRLFKVLHIVYHLPVEKVGETVYENLQPLIPVIIDVEGIMKQKNKYSWLLKFCKGPHNRNPTRIEEVAGEFK